MISSLTCESAAVGARAQVCKSGKNTKTSAGVLISADSGRSWEGHAVLVHSHSWLIENTLVEVRVRESERESTPVTIRSCHLPHNNASSAP